MNIRTERDAHEALSHQPDQEPEAQPDWLERNFLSVCIAFGVTLGAIVWWVVQ